MGGLRTDKNGNHLIKASLINVSYVEYHMYVHSPNPFSHGVIKFLYIANHISVFSLTPYSHRVNIEENLKTTHNKDVHKSRKKSINGRIWAAIAARILGGIPPGS